jgi:hypothetical protein
MPNYIADPNDSTKQIPGPLPDNHRGGANNPSQFVFTKTPSYVLVNTLLTTPVGFFFGSSASFSTNRSSQSAVGGGGQVFAQSSSLYTIMLNDASPGTKLDIHPTAWSGSAADAGSITFVYKGNSTGGF